MAQVWTDAEEQLLKEDPLHDVKDEIQHQSPHLKHVDTPEGNAPKDDAQMEDVVKSHVPEAYLGELKNDHDMKEPAVNLYGSESGFMADDPLHNVKQELEHHSPHLKHVESPFSSPRPQSGDVVQSEVPPAFEEELKNDHDIVKGATGAVTGDAASLDPHAVRNVEYLSSNVRDPAVLRGRPKFRISANVGNRPLGSAMTPEAANEDDEEEGVSNDASKAEEDSSSTMKEEVSPTKLIASRGPSARGTPHFRISAHQGMRPGGPLSRDLRSETASESNPSGGDGVGAELAGEMKPPGIPGRGAQSGVGPRRGGLARTGSGVPGESRGSAKGSGGLGLARTGSGVPGEQRGGLARTGSGVPGNSLARQGSGAFGGLARTGSGIPSSKGGNNDLKDFSSFLDSADFKTAQ